MENVTTNTGYEITKEKIDSYYSEKMHNFVGENEITVTITLSEYRNLVEKSIKSERDEERSKNWKLQKECEELKKKVEQLESMISDYCTKVDNTSTVSGSEGVLGA